MLKAMDFYKSYQKQLPLYLFELIPIKETPKIQTQKAFPISFLDKKSQRVS